MPVTAILELEPSGPDGSYYSDYWRCVFIALMFARETFYAERTVEYLQALRSCSTGEGVIEVIA